MTTTIWLGLAMAAIAVVNTALMAWLWRFPMVPDPTGRDPHGVSSAPRSWTNVHRGLGYVFVLLYVALLTEMLPRAWEFHEATTSAVVHGALGVFMGVVLAAKIAVIRRFKRFGHRLPWFGGTLAASTIAAVALTVPPAWTVVRPLDALPPALARGRDVVAVRCVQCHGASTIASEREDARRWDRITREMQEYSREIPGKVPITEEERALAVAYLTHVLGEADDEAEDADAAEEAEEGDERGHRRRRRRGRDR